MRLVSQLFSKPALRTQFQAKAAAFRPVAQFHSSPLLKQEEKTPEAVVPAEEVGSPYGLDDWKMTAPIGLAITIPAISNGVYVLNEESQLACCFMLFCTSIYKFGGDMIGSFFDERAKAILNEQNEAEDANIALAKETLNGYQAQMEIVDDIAALNVAQKEVVDLLCKVESAKLRHAVRDVYVKNLETIVAYENMYREKMQKHMVAYALEQVEADVKKGGKALKDETFKSALGALSLEEDKEDKEDNIAKLFCTHLETYAKKIEEQTGTVVQLTPEDMQQMQGELEVYLKRVGMEEIEVEVPSQITLGLIK